MRIQPKSYKDALCIILGEGAPVLLSFLLPTIYRILLFSFFGHPSRAVSRVCQLLPLRLPRVHEEPGALPHHCGADGDQRHQVRAHPRLLAIQSLPGRRAQPPAAALAPGARFLLSVAHSRPRVPGPQPGRSHRVPAGGYPRVILLASWSGPQPSTALLV